VDTRCSTPTTLTGKVFDPAGTTPLQEAVVFVPANPSATPAIVRGGPSCSLLSIGSYVSAAATSTDGSFKLSGVPTGRQVPVTVQIGKWRRTVHVNITNDCADNAVADGTLRLPRGRSEGDMPQLAVLTGGEDNLACLLLGMGIDPNELGPPGGGGRVDVYRGVGGADLTGDGGAGDCTGTSCPLWDTAAHLDAYEIILLGCEGGDNLQTKPATALQAMHDWVAAGGKLFGVHSQDVWLSHGPADFADVATWIDGGASGATGPFRINQSFPRGIQFRNWASGIGVADPDGGLPLLPSDVATSVGSVKSTAVPWILDESTSAPDGGEGNAKALSFSPPSAVDGGRAALVGCGRATLTDIHPGGTSAVTTVPSQCPAGGLNAEGKALEYLFFRQFDPPTPACGGCPPPPPTPPPDGG
jgi:hypothetical protein